MLSRSPAFSRQQILSVLNMFLSIVTTVRNHSIICLKKGIRPFGASSSLARIFPVEPFASMYVVYR